MLNKIIIIIIIMWLNIFTNVHLLAYHTSKMSAGSILSILSSKTTAQADFWMKIPTFGVKGYCYTMTAHIFFLYVVHTWS